MENRTQWLLSSVEPEQCRDVKGAVQAQTVTQKKMMQPEFNTPCSETVRGLSAALCCFSPPLCVRPPNEFGG